MRIVLLGPPGAGKGTQGVPLARRAGVPHVATGDLLRHAVSQESDVGLKARSYMDAGELVPDEVMLELVERRLSTEDARSGFVLDGFPRNDAQAGALDDMLLKIGHAIDVAMLIDAPDDVILQRLLARGREDDRPHVVARRLIVFRRETAPLETYYAERGLLHRIDGAGEAEVVSRRIMTTLEGEWTREFA